MQSKAVNVADYLRGLPADRRHAIEAVREVILKNIDDGFEEGMQYGMIGYYVPFRLYPAGYHCDPRQPLPYAGLASQKNYMSLYMMSLYGGCGGREFSGELPGWFFEAWKKTGKKLDMGKSCIRFKKLDDLALDVIAEAFRRVSAAKYIEIYELAREMTKAGPSKTPAPKPKAVRKRAAKK